MFTCLEIPIQGVDTYGEPIYRLAKYFEEIEGIFVCGDAQKFDEIDFPKHNGFITSNKTPVGYDASFEAFVGKYKTTKSPIAVETGKCGSGDADSALKVWEDINPANPNRPFKNQPNVFANGFYGTDHDYNPGMSEHVWTTGSASWLVPGVVENMIGLRRTRNCCNIINNDLR